MAKLLSGTRIYGNLTVDTWANAASANISGTTASTSTTTGALVVAGGVGIAGNVYSANLNIGGLSQAGLSITSTTSSRTAAIFFQDQYNLDIHPGAGYLILTRGNQNTGIGGNTSPSHRLSLKGDAYFDSNLTIAGTTTSTSTTTGALQVAGGVGIAGNLYVGSNASPYSVNYNSISLQGQLVPYNLVGSDGTATNTKIGRAHV